MADMRTRTARIILTALFVLAPAALAMAGAGDGHGGGHGHGASLKEHGYYLVNFLVFLGLVYALTGDSIRAAVRDRSRTTGREIREAGAVLDEARRREEEAKTSLNALPAREQEIEETFAAEGARLAETIETRTEREKTKLRDAAQATVEAERTSMRRALSRELAEMTLNEAERLMETRRGAMDQDRLFDGFIAGLAARGEGES